VYTVQYISLLKAFIHDSSTVKKFQLLSNIGYMWMFLSVPLLKGLSHEIDFENVDANLTDLGLNKGRGWFLNVWEVPLIFS
jgi:hypothetical protein